MKAFRCDRCGKYFTDPRWDYSSLVKKHIYTVDRYKVATKGGELERLERMDLCPECCEKLRKFMYNGEMEDR